MGLCARCGARRADRPMSAGTRRRRSCTRTSTCGTGSTRTATCSTWLLSSTTARPSSEPRRVGWQGGAGPQPPHGTLTCLLQRIHSQFKKEVSEARGGRRHFSEPAKHGWGFGRDCQRGLWQPAGGSLPRPRGGHPLPAPCWALPTPCPIDTLPGSFPAVLGWELVVFAGEFWTEPCTGLYSVLSWLDCEQSTAHSQE